MQQRRSRVGRPAASSRITLEEAAGELALEHGWDTISVSDIAARAGVSRSSFFNYFTAKADLLWTSLDDALRECASLVEVVEHIEQAGPPVALVHAEAMCAVDALVESAAPRGRLVAQRLPRATVRRLAGIPDASERDARIHAEMLGLGFVLTIADWAQTGTSRGLLRARLNSVLGDGWDAR